MPVLGVVAADEGVQALDLVDQTVFQQEIQRSVDCRWGRRLVAAPELVQDRIGSHWPVAVPDQFQDPAAEGGQAGAALQTQLFGPDQGVRDAMIVIMGRGCPNTRQNAASIQQSIGIAV